MSRELAGAVIRPLEGADLAAVDRLERAIYPTPWRREHFQRLLDLPEATAWVAELGGEVVGYAVGWIVADEAELANIAVAAAVRRRGLATQLLRVLESDIARRGARRLYLEVRESNRPARAFYRRHGFDVVGRRRGYYRAPREDALTMARELDRGPD